MASSLLNLTTNECDINPSPVSRTVTNSVKQVRAAITDLLTTYQRISIGDVSRHLRKIDPLLTNYIDLSISELQMEGILTLDESNPQITYLSAGGVAIKKMPRGIKTSGFVAPKNAAAINLPR